MSEPQRVVFAGDCNGAELAEGLCSALDAESSLDTVLWRIGPKERYAALAGRVAKSVVDGEFDRAVLFCGTGQGVMMAANNVPGIRAGLLNGPYAAERLALSNDAQIVCVGAVDGYGEAQDRDAVEEWVREYLGLKFDKNGPSAENVAAINEVDERYRRKPAVGEVKEK